MRKILALFLSLALLLGTAMPAFAATGEGNIDGGGGNMGSGNSSSYWNPGMDGVRVTVINAESHAVVTTPVDLTNKTPSTGIIHFGKVCKLTYNGGASLSPVVGGYSYRNPSQSLPRIISSGSSSASIEAIRSYFTDEQVIRSLAGYVGMDFDTLVNGDYKIIIEPIAYLNYDGQQFAMTATEAALYDQVVSGDLRYWMGSLTHQNLPLAIFLEEADLGYPAWSGSTTSKVSNEQIISSLGIGIVRFNDEVEEPEVDAFDYEYRVDTHEKRYRDWLAQYDAMFAPENRSPQQDEQFPLTDGYSIRSKAYIYDGDLHLCGSESELLDNEGKVRYAWRNLDTDGEFCSLFRHRNGKHYLIFRTELYGYSVLEVESGQEMHYVPACVHPEEGQKTEEVFIWTGADYDPGTDLLAVTGCIWACPYSTIVLDFSCPLQPQLPERWLDLRHIVDPDDTRFDDIEFVRWDSDSLLLRGCDTEDDRWKEIAIQIGQIQQSLMERQKCLPCEKDLWHKEE